MIDRDQEDLAEELGILATWWGVTLDGDSAFLITEASADAAGRAMVDDDPPDVVQLETLTGGKVTVRVASITAVYVNTPAMRREDYAREVLMEREKEAFKKEHKPATWADE